MWRHSNLVCTITAAVLCAKYEYHQIIWKQFSSIHPSTWAQRCLSLHFSLSLCEEKVKWPHMSQNITSLLSGGWCMRAEMASAETADHTHTHTRIHTNTRLMDDTSVRSRMEAGSRWTVLGGWETTDWRWPAAAINVFIALLLLYIYILIIGCNLISKRRNPAVRVTNYACFLTSVKAID